MENNFMEEIWKPIPGWEEFYSVSNLGRVLSHRKGKILAPSHSCGYPVVTLCSGKLQKVIQIHILVLAAFRGRRPPGEVSCHNDGNRSNNIVSNLRYGTQQSNALDKNAHGTMLRGEKSPTAKLREVQVRQILKHKGKLFSHEIAEIFGVSPSTIKDILSGKTWKHVK